MPSTPYDRDSARHLRIIHACEKGATGVYYGHRLMAWLFYRDLVAPLTEMHGHETEHYAIFAALIAERRSRKVLLPAVWCGGGIVYGMITGLAGRRGVWKSTAVIEAIVEHELEISRRFFFTRDDLVANAIATILIDEREHKHAAESNSASPALTDKPVAFMARLGAKIAKSSARL